jgi:hypothetical protein
MIDSSHGGVGRERRSQRGGSRITSMTIDEFLLIERAVRVSRPGLFRLAKPDPCASDVELAHVEQELGCKLPGSYRQFMLRCGGGDYPLTSIFSAYRGSSWYIVQKRRELDALLPTALLPMHDDNAGGLFVLKIEDGCALEPVYYYDWESKELSGARHANILEFVAMNFD